MTDYYLGVADNIVDVLLYDMNDTQTTFQPVDMSKFTSLSLPFALTVSDAANETNVEEILVTGISGGNFTGCTRNYNGRGAFTHAGGSTISLRLIAKHVSDVSDVAIMQLARSSYTELTRNGTNQVITVTVWEDSTKTTRRGQTDYTYATTADTNPVSAVRVIYKSDGNTIRRTETTTFTYASGVISVLNRVIT